MGESRGGAGLSNIACIAYHSSALQMLVKSEEEIWLIF